MRLDRFIWNGFAVLAGMILAGMGIGTLVVSYYAFIQGGFLQILGGVMCDLFGLMCVIVGGAMVWSGITGER